MVSATAVLVGTDIVLANTGAAFADTETTRDTMAESTWSPDIPWQTVVWNDPVNLMSYVTHVFRSYFGYSTSKAQQLMLQVHHDGRAVVASGPREEMERHAEAMHEYGLWATVDRTGL